MDGIEQLKDRFKDAMRTMASTVSIVSVKSGGVRHGTTATAVTSVSMDPPSLLVCLNRDSRLHALLLQEDLFCVNFLHADNLEVSQAFSRPIEPNERFQFGDWEEEGGVPFLADAQASVACQKEVEVPYGSHTVFIGRVLRVRTRGDVAPLLYAGGGYSYCKGLEPGSETRSGVERFVDGCRRPARPGLVEMRARQ